MHMQELDISEDLWEKYESTESTGDAISRPSYTYFEESWRSLKKNKLAMIAIVIIVLMIGVAFFGPIFSPYKYDEQNLDYASLSYRMQTYHLKEDIYIHLANGLRIYQVSKDGEVESFVEPVETDMVKKTKTYQISGETFHIDFNKRPIQIINTQGIHLEEAGKVFNKTHLLGTDKLGRDMLVRLMYGARISFTVAIIATTVNVLIGVMYGGIAGYFGGWVDNLMTRTVDVISAVPMMLYIILLMVVIGPGLKTIIIAMGVVFWIGTARLVRGEILSLKSKEYVMAAKMIGVSDLNIIIRHLLPNAMGPIMVSLTFMIPEAIFTEAFLSFIGLGIPAPQASWGTLCESAVEGLQTYPYQLFFPAAAISITILAFNILGDGLRDALDPRLRN